MSDYCIFLKLPSYFRQWFIHRHSGEEPVTLRRGSIESKMLQRATVPLPDNCIPDREQDGETAVFIPYSKSHDPITYNHITPSGKRAMLSRIKDNFDLDVWDSLHDLGKIGKQQKNLIYLFMEKCNMCESYNGIKQETTHTIYSMRM